MIEVLDSAGKVLLNHLLAIDPTLEAFLERGQPSLEKCQTVHPRLNIPSLHPTIKTPLTIELGGHLQMFWHRGYFYDFVGPAADRSSEAIEFLRKFFAEELYCGVFVQDGRVRGGGPMTKEELPLFAKRIASPKECLEVRSWRGTFDQDFVP